MKPNVGNKYNIWEERLVWVAVLIFGMVATVPLSMILDIDLVSLLALVVSIAAFYIAFKNKKPPSSQQRLDQLEELKASGRVTEEEYAAKRQEILNDL